MNQPQLSMVGFTRRQKEKGDLSAPGKSVISNSLGFEFFHSGRQFLDGVD